MLSKHAANCRFPHGHSRRIDIVVVSDELDAGDMVCDFKALKAALAPSSPSGPTSERMAQAVFSAAKRRLHEASANAGATPSIPARVRIERVRVTETSSSWAEYFE